MAGALEMQGISNWKIDRHAGAVVKTVGDAIMAAFLEPVNAVRAMVELQSGMERYNRMHPDQEPLVVKPGVHVGACLAVRLNDRLDYFGTTVNLAARVQNEARGMDLVLSDSMMVDPEVRAYLETVPTQQRDVRQVILKGLSGTHHLTFINLDGGALVESNGEIGAGSARTAV
jgi:class 3 adenylate cyclase